MSLLDKRIVIVTGKGGTGKTTVAAAIGLWAAREGKRTLICETHGTSRISATFDRPAGGYTPVSIQPRLSVMSITSTEAIEDYVVQQIKVKQLYKLVFRNRVMGPFMDAVPGLHDAVHLGKVFDLARETGPDGAPVWDLVVVDAPATGHGLHMFDAPRSMMELTRGGPVYEGVKLVDDVIGDPSKTALVLTCLPEEMPVSETLDLWTRLGERRSQIAACVLNEIAESPLDDLDDWEAAWPTLFESSDPALREAVDLTQNWVERIVRQEQCRETLTAALDAPVVDLPLQPHRSLGFTDLELLSKALSTGLEAQ